ncbi:MAG: hypothetical protein ACYC1L_02930 [Alphaproteobacteria bacterium]
MQMPNRRRLYGPLIMLGFLALSPPPAWSQATPQTDPQMQELIGRLNAITDQAERTRGAKPNIIKSLRELAAAYDRPWHTVLLREDFRDGDYTKAPAWQVVQGEFWVDSQGLRSRAKADAPASAQQGNANDPTTAILGMVLNRMQQNAGGQQQQAAVPVKVNPAEIFVPVGITNAFDLRMEVAVLDGGAPFLFGPFLGTDRNTGYRMVYSPSPQNGRGTLELLRLTGRGSVVAGQAAAPVNLEGAALHVIEWTRTRQGEMAVTVDGKEVMRLTDVGVREAFGGLAVTNLGGDYAVRGISVTGTP